MPAPTASRRSAYSWGVIEGTVVLVNAPLPGPLPCGETEDFFLVGGKLSHRLCDFLGVRHDEIFLRCVEGHRGHVRRRDTDHRTVEVVEGVLGDDRRHLRAKPSCQVV